MQQRLLRCSGLHAKRCATQHSTQQSTEDSSHCLKQQHRRTISVHNVAGVQVQQPRACIDDLGQGWGQTQVGRRMQAASLCGFSSQHRAWQAHTTQAACAAPHHAQSACPSQLHRRRGVGPSGMQAVVQAAASAVLGD